MNRVDALHLQYIRARAQGKTNESRRALVMMHDAGYVICPRWRIIRAKGHKNTTIFTNELAMAPK